MTLALSQLDLALTFSDSECLFEKLCSDIEQQGYSINPMALPLALADGLLQQANTLQEQAFEPAGIGRNEQHLMNNFVRSDEIVWINGESRAESAWLDWSNSLKRYLNRRLYLGLFSFESHFASYKAGHFYKRHIDAFHGQTNRVLSLVVYLNKDWQAEEAVSWYYTGTSTTKPALESPQDLRP